MLSLKKNGIFIEALKEFPSSCSQKIPEPELYKMQTFEINDELIKYKDKPYANDQYSY